MLKGVFFLAWLALPGRLWADSRMVLREAAWGGVRRDTLVVWQTTLIHLNTLRINRSYPRPGRSFADTVEFIPNYTDSVYYLLPNFDVYFSRSLSADSAFQARPLRLTLSGGTLQLKTLTDKRRIGDTTCVHRQWVWTNCQLDSAGKTIGSADLELDYWAAERGFKGKADLDFFNQFRKKNFQGRRLFEGLEAERISNLLGIRLAEFEKQARATPIFPMEMALTLKRKLTKGTKNYMYSRQVVQLAEEQRDVSEFRVPAGYKPVAAPERKPAPQKRGK